LPGTAWDISYYLKQGKIRRTDIMKSKRKRKKDKKQTRLGLGATKEIFKEEMPKIYNIIGSISFGFV
jgi:hypothetical protein